MIQKTTLGERVAAFSELGEFLSAYREGDKKEKDQTLDELIDRAYHYNGWFNRENVLKALHGINLLLKKEDLLKFSKQIEEPVQPKTVAVIMAGNIPAVGFHDLLCVLLSGNRILIKLSSDDKLFIPFFTDFLIEKLPALKDYILYSEARLHDFDAIIATGSNNSAVYFKQYFGKYPHIIRKNRTSVAVLSGKETTEDLQELGKDIFTYFGLGCRNVSKLFVPAGYSFDTFFESIFSYGDVINNKKYANNYDYTRAVYLLNHEKFLENNFLMLRPSTDTHSPIGVLYCEEYKDVPSLEVRLKEIEPELQCIVTNMPLSVTTVVPGCTQYPSVFSFADNINTLAFLNKLR
jgi:hypothetical protein